MCLFDKYNFFGVCLWVKVKKSINYFSICPFISSLIVYFFLSVLIKNENFYFFFTGELYGVNGTVLWSIC